MIHTDMNSHIRSSLLQSEHFHPQCAPIPPNLLREKLILFLALHSLSAPKLSQKLYSV